MISGTPVETLWTEANVTSNKYALNDMSDIMRFGSYDTGQFSAYPYNRYI